jgi:aryl-alcohol dehydrogenase-like predicted oxidoreductase
MSSPANQHKLDVVEELAVLAEKEGLTLIELALAFVINHPGVTSAIIGPRTMEQLESQLPAADITLSAAVRSDRRAGCARGDAEPGRQQLRCRRTRTDRPPPLTTD